MVRTIAFHAINAGFDSRTIYQDFSTTKRRFYMYKVLAPIYKEAGYDFNGDKIYQVRWKQVGTARNMQEAKKIVAAPVLEEI